MSLTSPPSVGELERASARRPDVIKRAGQVRHRRVAWTAGVAACVVAAVAIPLALSASNDRKDVRVVNSPPSTVVTPSTNVVPTTGPRDHRAAVATTTAPQAPQNLTVTDALKANLLSLYVAATHVPAAEVVTQRASVFYAYVPSTKTYWAVGTYVPTNDASEQTITKMQNGGQITVFSRTPTGSWTIKSRNGIPFPCPGVLLPELQRLWGFQTPGGCHS
jgi:hypothetical protein